MACDLVCLVASNPFPARGLHILLYNFFVARVMRIAAKTCCSWMGNVAKDRHGEREGDEKVMAGRVSLFIQLSDSSLLDLTRFEF